MLPSTHRTIRSEAVFATAGVITIGLFAFYYQQRYGFSEKFKELSLYSAQVLSGNWSPDAKVGNGWIFLTGLLLAVILNLLTVTGVTVAAFNLYFQNKAREMEKMAAFELRSADQKDRLLELLDDETAQRLSDVIDRAFDEGHQIWKDKTLPSVFGKAGAEKFLASVEKPQESGNNDRTQQKPTEPNL